MQNGGDEEEEEEVDGGGGEVRRPGGAPTSYGCCSCCCSHRSDFVQILTSPVPSDGFDATGFSLFDDALAHVQGARDESGNGRHTEHHDSVILDD